MLINTKWSHLPNAAHINRIITSIKLYPDHWDEVQMAESDNVRDTAWHLAMSTLDPPRDQVWFAVSDEAWMRVASLGKEAKWKPRGALMCLVAYNDCAYMLDSEVGELKILAAFGDHRAILLLPACIVLNAIKEIENVT